MLNIFELPGVSGIGTFEVPGGEGCFEACHGVFKAASAEAGFDFGAVPAFGIGVIGAFTEGVGTGLLEIGAACGFATTFSAFFVIGAGVFFGGAEAFAWILLIAFFAASLAFSSNPISDVVIFVGAVTEAFADVVGLGATGEVVVFTAFTVFGFAGVAAAAFVDFARVVVVFFTGSGTSTPTASTTTFLGLPLFFATSADIFDCGLGEGSGQLIVGRTERVWKDGAVGLEISSRGSRAGKIKARGFLD